MLSISSRFAVAIHILSLLGINKDQVNTSEWIAGSVNTNPVVIRKITGYLKNAGLVHVRPGVAGASLARDLSDISLLDVYKAVQAVPENELFGIHDQPNPACTVGRNIQQAIEPLFVTAQLALEKALGDVTIADVVSNILEQERQRSN